VSLGCRAPLFTTLSPLVECRQTMETPSTRKTRNPRRTRLLVGVAVVLVAVGALLWLAIGRGTVYYYSVSELRALGSTQHVRVSGELEGGSLANEGSAHHTFTIFDRDDPAAKLTIVLDGALPDAFKDQAGAEVVAEGDYDGSGTFLAGTLITKCPSKYQAAP
jgi:cytochrome c-type biogenesis protein CcmE